MFGFFSRENNIAYRALREHLAETDLNLDQQVKYFDTLSRANSNTKIAAASIGAACITAIIGLTSGFLIRDYESDKIRLEQCAMPDEIVNYMQEVDERFAIIQRELTYTGDHYKIHHQQYQTFREFLQSLREKQFFEMGEEDRLRKLIEESSKPKL